MMQSRFGFRAIGLCLALSGMMAVGAGLAQAEVGAKWLIQGTAVTDALAAGLQSELEGSHGVLLAEIGGKGIHILCTGMSLVKGNVLLVEGRWLGKALFSGCKILQLTVLNGATAVLGACMPAEGHITTALLKALLQLHVLSGGAKDTIAVIEPDTAGSTLIATITTGEECSFGGQIKIHGKLAVIDTEVSVSKVTHLIKEFAPLTKLFVNGNEANKATLDGSANITLLPPHGGLNWAGDPA